MTMAVHNYRPRQFHRTSNRENPSRGYRHIGSESLAAARPPKPWRQYPSRGVQPKVCRKNYHVYSTHDNAGIVDIAISSIDQSRNYVDFYQTNVSIRMLLVRNDVQFHNVYPCIVPRQIVTFVWPSRSIYDSWGPFYQHGLTLIPAWISNYVHYRLYDEITYRFLNFNGCTVEV